MSEISNLKNKIFSQNEEIKQFNLDTEEIRIFKNEFILWS